LRFAHPRAIGLEVGDEFTVPLCRGHHRQLHQAGNEVPGGRRSISMPCRSLGSLGNKHIPFKGKWKKISGFRKQQNNEREFLIATESIQG